MQTSICLSLRLTLSERQADGLHTPPVKIAKEEEQAVEKKPSAQESMEMMELRKYNLELEERVAGLSRRAESQQAEIDEATYYIYDHGVIKTELEQLRRTKITNLVEINRLTSENVKQGMELYHAEE
jgi:hypothetical protein